MDKQEIKVYEIRVAAGDDREDRVRTENSKNDMTTLKNKSGDRTEISNSRKQDTEKEDRIDINRASLETYKNERMQASNDGTMLTKTVSLQLVTERQTNIDADLCNRETRLAFLQQEFLRYSSEKTLNELQELADSICSPIRTKYKNANYVWLAYKENKECLYGIQIFMMIEIQDDSNLSVDDFPDRNFEVCVYKIGEIKSEEEEVLYETDIAEELSYRDLIKMRTSINKHADTLLACHKHLTIIEPSGIRLKHSTYIKEKCISLYVCKKGFIPIGETPFESAIEEFTTDVREGIAYQAMQNEGAATLKMGCKIARLESSQETVTKFGTLGGFIDHPEYGMCGLTSAHVLLNNTEMQTLIEKGEITWLQISSKIEVYFCDEDNIKIGNFVKAVYEKGHEGSHGFEVAIFQIGSTFKTVGEFHDTKNEGDDRQHVFHAGKVFCPINCSQDLSLLKFGARTGKTTGAFTQHLPVSTIRLHAIPNESVSDRITLWNQIVIAGREGKPFSRPGDSGSLVMVRGEDGEVLCVGIVEGVTKNNIKTHVSPIGPVLQKLSVSSFKCYQQDELVADVRTLKHTTTEILQAVNELKAQRRPFCNIM